MRRTLVTTALTLVAIGLFTIGISWAGRGDANEGVLGPGEVTVRMTIHHSHFEPDEVRVRPGTAVTFIVTNRDPIGHELIVGDDEVHRRHELGTEPAHEPRPGEISIPALTSQTTTFTFPQTGDVLYACHLPGHVQYGMSGYVHVVADP